MKTIAVLMSTYNGQKYLESQLNSILHQNIDKKLYKILIYIRDDGSKDNTLQIIENYKSKYPNSVFLVDQSSLNLGVKGSFIKLAQIVKANYYFFSDQDDIWVSNKIAHMVSVLAKHDIHPAGVYSDLWIANEKAKSTGVLMKHDTENTKKVLENKLSIDCRQLLFTYLVTGASFAFNNSFKEKYIDNMNIAELNDIRMHDCFFAILLAIESNLYYIDEPLVLYRQHSNNVVGAVKTKKKGIIDYLLNLKEPIDNRIRLLLDAKKAISLTDVDTSKVRDIKRFILIFSGRNYFKRWVEVNKNEYFLTISPKISEKLLYTFFVHI